MTRSEVSKSTAKADISTHTAGSRLRAEAAEAIEPSRSRTLTPWQRVARRPEFGSVIGFVAMAAIFLYLSGGVGFLSVDGVVNLIGVAAEIGIVASFVTILMIAGEFDIGFGAVLASGSIIMVLALLEGLPLWLGLVIALAVACAVAAGEGYTVVRRGIPSLFVTLAVGYILRAIVTVPYDNIIYPQYNKDLHPLIQADPIFVVFRGTFLGGLPISVLWWIGVTLIVWHILSNTSFGNWVSAIGDSPGSARALGVPVLPVRFAVFFGTAIGGTILAALQVSRVGSADPANGVYLPFEAMIAVFIGGTRSGSGSIVGTVLGACTLAILRQGMIFIGVSAYLYSLALGTALLIAYAINQLLRRWRFEEVS